MPKLQKDPFYTQLSHLWFWHPNTVMQTTLWKSLAKFKTKSQLIKNSTTGKGIYEEERSSIVFSLWKHSNIGRSEKPMFSLRTFCLPGCYRSRRHLRFLWKQRFIVFVYLDHKWLSLPAYHRGRKLQTWWLRCITKAHIDDSYQERENQICFSAE